MEDARRVTECFLGEFGFSEPPQCVAEERQGAGHTAAVAKPTARPSGRRVLTRRATAVSVGYDHSWCRYVRFSWFLTYRNSCSLGRAGALARLRVAAGWLA